MLPQSRHARGSVLTAFFMISLNGSICIRKSSQANFAAFILPFRKPRLNEVPCMCPTRMDSTIIEAVLTSWMPPHHIGMLVERHTFDGACHAVRLGQLDGRLRCWCCNNCIGFVNQVFRIFIRWLSFFSPLICWRAKFFEGRHLTLRSGRSGLHPFQAKQCFLPTPCRTTLRMWCRLNGLSNVSFGHEDVKQPQRQLQSWNWSGAEAPGTAWTQNNCHGQESEAWTVTKLSQCDAQPHGHINYNTNIQQQSVWHMHSLRDICCQNQFNTHNIWLICAMTSRQMSWGTHSELVHQDWRPRRFAFSSTVPKLKRAQTLTSCTWLMHHNTADPWISNCQPNRAMTTDKLCDHINAQQQVRTLFRGTGIISDQRHKPCPLTECVVNSSNHNPNSMLRTDAWINISMTTSAIDRLVLMTRPCDDLFSQTLFKPMTKINKSDTNKNNYQIHQLKYVLQNQTKTTPELDTTNPKRIPRWPKN